MNRRSRLPRIAKWCGVAVCVLLLATWVSQYVRTAASSRSRARMASGDRVISIDGTSVQSYLDIFAASSKIKPYAMTLVDSSGRTYSVRYDPGFQSGVLGLLANLPIWTVLLVAIPTAALFRFDRRMPPGHCLHCGYNLTGLPEPRCPECGQPFERNGDTP